MRTKALSATLLTAALLIATPLSSSANIISGPIGGTSGTVDSGQTYFTVFSTQRTASSSGFRVRQVSSSPGAEGRYVAYNCAATAQISYHYVLANGQSAIPVNPGSGARTSGCFRIGLRRQNPADTNGWGFGNGNTTFNLEVLNP